MEPTVEFDIQLLRRRLMRASIALGVIGVIAVAALAWSCSLGRAAARRVGRLQSVSAGIDRLMHLVATQDQRMDPLEQQLGAFGTLEDRLSATLGEKTDRATVASVRARMDAMAGHLARSDSLLALLQGEVVRSAGQLTAARSDSLAALRRLVNTELAGIRDEARLEQDNLRALDLRIESLDEARHRGHTGDVLRDGATLLNTGLIVAHVLDDDGR